MIRSRVVMYRRPAGDTHNAVYFQGGGPNTEMSDGYHMTHNAYMDFDQPHVITVTVDLGNQLEKDKEECYGRQASANRG